MKVVELQQAGLGIFGWLIVVIAGTFIWNMITKKDDVKQENDIMKENIRTDGYYKAILSGTSIYGHPFELSLFLFFNKLGYVCYFDEEGNKNLDNNTIKEIVSDISEIEEANSSMAKYELNDGIIDMIFFQDDKRFYTQWSGNVKGDCLTLNCINQTHSYKDNKLEKTKDHENVQFSFIKF